MRRRTVYWLIIFSLHLCRAIGPEAAAQPVSAIGGFTSRIQAQIGDRDSLRCRISAGCKSLDGELGAFVDEECSAGGIAFSGFGLASPSCDLGPLRESGLMSALNHPSGIGSIAERTATSLDRALDPSSLTGGVIRLYTSGAAGRGVELYGAGRGGLAPDGTKTGGASLTTGLGGGLSLDVGSKITLFGVRDEEDAWFLDAPDTIVPSIFRTGARVMFRGRRAIAVVSAGAAFSDAMRPASFVTGCIGISGDLPEGGGAGQRIAAYSLRLDAGAVDPDYVGDDGRFVTRTLLVHPVVSLRLPGMRATGWYRCDLYRLPVLPASYRRIVHSGNVDGEVRFGPLSVGTRLRPSLDFTADGRTIYRMLCGPRSRLSVGGLSIETELELSRSNVEDPKVGARLALCSQWERGMVGVSLDVDERLARLKAELTLEGRQLRLTATLTVPEILAVDFSEPHVALNGDVRDALAGASCSVAFEIGR